MNESEQEAIYKLLIDLFLQSPRRIHLHQQVSEKDKNEKALNDAEEENKQQQGEKKYDCKS